MKTPGTLLSSGLGLLVDLLRRIHRKVPPSIRRRYYPILSRWYDRLIRLGLDVYFPPVFFFSGQANGSDLPLSFAYAGTEKTAREYWAQAVLAPGFSVQRLGRRLSWRIAGRLRSEYPEFGFVLVEHTASSLPRVSRTPGFRTPFWVDMEVILPNLSQGGWGHQRRDIARRIRKYGLRYELSKDPMDFQDFLENMHLPYITNRFDEGALHPDANYLTEVLSRGELILVKKEQEVVGGCLFEYFPTMIWMRKLGVRDGDWRHVKEGVVGALYYFLMEVMEDRGYEKIYLGGTRPLLNDGVTRFKASLNAQLVPNVRAVGPVSLWLTMLTRSPGFEEFLVGNPFVYFPQPDRPCRAVFTRPGSDGWEDQLTQVLRVSDCRGLMGTTVFALGGGEALSAAEEAVSGLGSEIQVRPAYALFQAS